MQIRSNKLSKTKYDPISSERGAHNTNPNDPYQRKCKSSKKWCK